MIMTIKLQLAYRRLITLYTTEVEIDSYTQLGQLYEIAHNNIQDEMHYAKSTGINEKSLVVRFTISHVI